MTSSQAESPTRPHDARSIEEDPGWVEGLTEIAPGFMGILLAALVLDSLLDLFPEWVKTCLLLFAFLFSLPAVAIPLYVGVGVGMLAAYVGQPWIMIGAGALIAALSRNQHRTNGPFHGFFLVGVLTILLGACAQLFVFFMN